MKFRIVETNSGFCVEIYGTKRTIKRSCSIFKLDKVEYIEGWHRVTIFGGIRNDYGRFGLAESMLDAFKTEKQAEEWINSRLNPKYNILKEYSK